MHRVPPPQGGGGDLSDGPIGVGRIFNGPFSHSPHLPRRASSLRQQQWRPGRRGASDLAASKSLVDTCAALLDSRTLYEEVAQLSDPDGGYKSWHRRVTAASVEGSEVFRVYVTDRDPTRAAAIANAVAEVFPGYVSGIAEGCSLHVVDRATVPEKRYAPSSAKYAALAGLLGAVLSCAWVVMSGLAAELKGSAACAAYKGR